MLELDMTGCMRYYIVETFYMFVEIFYMGRMDMRPCEQ